MEEKNNDIDSLLLQSEDFKDFSKKINEKISKYVVDNPDVMAGIKEVIDKKDLISITIGVIKASCIFLDYAKDSLERNVQYNIDKIKEKDITKEIEKDAHTISKVIRKEINDMSDKNFELLSTIVAKITNDMTLSKMKEIQ